MKELSIGMLLAILEEIFGAGLFWGMVICALVVIGLFVLLIIRDKGLIAGRFLWSEITAPIGALAAILFVQIMTDSGFKDLGGPIDLILIIAIGCGGALVAPMFTYLLLGLRDSHR